LPRSPRRTSPALPRSEGQEEQLGALGLIVNAIVLYNTICTQRALDHIAAAIGGDHATLTGRYRVILPGRYTAFR
jgi:Tn3 transposase DDE domain